MMAQLVVLLKPGNTQPMMQSARSWGGPLAVETYGNWGREVREVFSRLASFGQASHKSGFLMEIFSHLNMSLVRSIALGRALV